MKLCFKGRRLRASPSPSLNTKAPHSIQEQRRGERTGGGKGREEKRKKENPHYRGLLESLFQKFQQFFIWWILRRTRRAPSRMRVSIWPLGKWGRDGLYSVPFHHIVGGDTSGWDEMSFSQEHRQANSRSTQE